MICLRISSVVIKQTIMDTTSLQTFSDHGKYKFCPSVVDVTARTVHMMAYNRFSPRLMIAPFRPNCCHLTSISRFITGWRMMSNSWFWTAISRAEYAGDLGSWSLFPSKIDYDVIHQQNKFYSTFKRPYMESTALCKTENQYIFPLHDELFAQRTEWPKFKGTNWKKSLELLAGLNKII